MMCDNVPPLIVVKFCCYPVVIIFICMLNGEWQSDWPAEVLATLQYTVLFRVTPIRWDFLFTVQGSITVALLTSGRIAVMLCGVSTAVSL
jgi:hypothetical protein